MPLVILDRGSSRIDHALAELVIHEHSDWWRLFIELFLQLTS
jgi:hypothetical protein